ncbi:isocitrate dehydrogenase [NADP], chloroplastic/mitochondrial [Spatholobus suberectus]|nr:isocitrate dehydrogenase [NADP], chloroplastic/mitochondrial [Spatholobus suberectus]
MAGGANFMQRVLSYVVNEVVVNGLANSPAFQRFAVRTSKRIEDISSKAIQKRQELAEQIKDISKNMESFKKQ